jgi:hypothetical protein
MHTDVLTLLLQMRMTMMKPTQLPGRKAVTQIPPQMQQQQVALRQPGVLRVTPWGLLLLGRSWVGLTVLRIAVHTGRCC